MPDDPFPDARSPLCLAQEMLLEALKRGDLRNLNIPHVAPEIVANLHLLTTYLDEVFRREPEPVP